MVPGEHRLRGIMQRAFYDGMTFEEVMDAICDPTGKSRVGTVLKSLGMLDKTVTPDRLSELRYAVDNVKELKHNEEIPEKVAINEAVELAKKFGGDEAPAFVNGILAKLIQKGN